MDQSLASRDSSYIQIKRKERGNSGLDSMFESLCEHLVARDETDSSGASLYGDQHERWQTTTQLSRAALEFEDASVARRAKGKGAFLALVVCLSDHKSHRGAPACSRGCVNIWWPGMRQNHLAPASTETSTKDGRRPQQLSRAFLVDENASSSGRHKGKDALLALVGVKRCHVSSCHNLS
jgi:hypothetical protein